MSLEARVTELQNEANGLRKQVVELKEVLETELGRMRAQIQMQLSEARQLLLTCESESMARVAQLEGEVANLTRVCERALHNEDLLDRLSSEGHTSCSARRTPQRGDERQTPSLSPEEGGFSREAALSIQLSAAAVEPSAAVNASGVQSAIADLKGRLDDVFSFYTATSVANSALLHPEMHLSHFTAMMRDVGLCSSRRPALPDLMWMAVMRNLPATPAPQRPPRRTGSTLLQPRVYRDAESRAGHKSSFAHERLQTLSRERFGEALYITYCAAFPCADGTTLPLERFRAFLMETFLPSAEQYMYPQKPRPQLALASRSVSSTDPSMETSIAMSASPINLHDPGSIPFEEVVARYAEDEAAQKVLQQYTPQLKQSFKDAVCCPPNTRLREVRMSLETFAEYIRCHSLLPLLSKTQLKTVFLHCLRAQPREQSMRGGNCITYTSFVSAVYCLAELIYGCDSALQQQYPSPHARLSKLLVKVLVL